MNARSRTGPVLGSLAVVIGAAAVAAGIVSVVYGMHGALTFAMLVAIGAVALGVAHVAAVHRRRVGGLSRQFALAVALAVGQMVVAVTLIALAMFVSHHDALIVILMAAFAGAIAVRAAQLLAGGVMRDVEAVRDGLSAVAEGERDRRIRTDGRDELAQLADHANAMVDRLAVEEAARDAADAARRDLVAAISHDLRTPITSLQLLAEAVGDEIVDEATRRRYLDTMTTHIRALGVLIDDLFELSRLEAGEIGWSMERVAVGDLVGETVSAMRVAGEAKGVRVVADVADGLDAVRANPKKVQRVLFNLIQNAIRHTPADGSVTVRAQGGEDGLEIEVADTGEGIVARDRAHVFDAFFRGGSEAARTRNGAGLGLAISRAIVEAHGGRIWLEPAAPGTRVRFTLPRS